MSFCWSLFWKLERYWIAATIHKDTLFNEANGLHKITIGIIITKITFMVDKMR